RLGVGDVRVGAVGGEGVVERLAVAHGDDGDGAGGGVAVVDEELVGDRGEGRQQVARLELFDGEATAGGTIVPVAAEAGQHGGGSLARSFRVYEAKRSTGPRRRGYGGGRQ